MLHRIPRTSRLVLVVAALVVESFVAQSLAPQRACAQQMPPMSTIPATVNPNQPAVGTPAVGQPISSGGGIPVGFNGVWRAPNGDIRPAATQPGTTTNGLTPVNATPRAPITKVTSGTGALPNKDGQVWREYDISPYTARVTSTNRPEQALVDWILRETGYEAWHSNVVSVLSADARVLRVYHTPEVQAMVADVVDRFVNSQGASQIVNVAVVSIDGPSWRTRAQSALQPVPVQTQGISAWLIARENASLLITELRKRSDFREHSRPQLYIASGQSSVVSLVRPRPYTADIVMKPDAWPGYEAKAAQFDEGFSIEISPLASLDGRSLDAVVKVNIDQLERLQALAVEVPSAVAPRQRTEISVPQVSQFRLHDRFRWPVDAVLVVSLGVVPLPSAADAATVGGFRMPAMLSGGPARGEMLVFIDSRSAATATPAATPTVQPTTPGLTPIAPGNTGVPTVGGLPVVPLTPSRARY
jgi:hypothetical protein